MTAICPAGPPKVCSEISEPRPDACRNGTTSRRAVARLRVGSVDAGPPGVADGSWRGRVGPGQAGSRPSSRRAAVVLVQAVEDRPGHGEDRACRRRSSTARAGRRRGRAPRGRRSVRRRGRPRGRSRRSSTAPGRSARSGAGSSRSVQSPPWWPSSTPRMSNGVASAGHLGRVGDEHELGVRVDEPADQPRAGGPVDVHAGPGRPPHRWLPSAPTSRRRPGRRRPGRRRAAGAARAPAAGSSRGGRSLATAVATAARPGAATRPGRRRRRLVGRISARTRRPVPRPSVRRARRSCAAARGRASHTAAVPPASTTCSATQSSCSRVRASAGSATRPSPSCATPSRFSRRHTAIRGVDGSRGIR